MHCHLYKTVGESGEPGGLAFCRTKHDPAAIRGAFIRWWGYQIMPMICDSFIQKARDVEGKYECPRLECTIQEQ